VLADANSPLDCYAIDRVHGVLRFQDHWLQQHKISDTAASTAFPQPAPGTAPSFGPMLVPVEKLHTVLGITNVEVRRRKGALAITDTPLAAS
jgi:hypothetical protein